MMMSELPSTMFGNNYRDMHDLCVVMNCPNTEYHLKVLHYKILGYTKTPKYQGFYPEEPFGLYMRDTLDGSEFWIPISAQLLAHLDWEQWALLPKKENWEGWSLYCYQELIRQRNRE